MSGWDALTLRIWCRYMEAVQALEEACEHWLPRGFNWPVNPIFPPWPPQPQFPRIPGLKRSILWGGPPPFAPVVSAPAWTFTDVDDFNPRWQVTAPGSWTLPDPDRPLFPRPVDGFIEDGPLFVPEPGGDEMWPGPHHPGRYA